MIDVHCHLADSKYQGFEIHKIVDETNNAGVGMILNGTGVKENRIHLDIAKGHDNIWVCVGMAYEPGHEDLKKTRAELEKWCNQPKVIGIGEAGLNYYSGMNEKLRLYQLGLFEMHLQLARDLDVPIQVHNRAADTDIYDLVKKYKTKTLLHCYTSSIDFMRETAQLGCCFSFGGMITYKSNSRLRDVVRQIPKDRLLLETDSPYLPPEPLRGTINTPINVKIVAEKIAVIRGVSYEEIEKMTSENAQRLFSKMR